jgi:general secretion pathway protein A
MYESFYGLKEKPFSITPDPDYFFMSQVHEDAYTHLQYAIRENKGFVVITGEIGSGKTTLINLLLKNVEQDILVGVISNANVRPQEFIRMACQELEIAIDGLGKVEMIDALHQFLLNQFAQRKRVVLIIDEAQNLPLETIEEIRMLSNLDTEKDHLVQMILVGQPELKAKLQQRQLKQFVQRVTVHCHLRGLSHGETRQYIEHRLRVAGAKAGGIFDEEAIEAVHEHARGIPRMINILCDAALLYGYADDRKAIGKEAIEEVVKERQAEGFFFPAGEEEQTPPATDSTLQGLEERLATLEKKINVIGRSLLCMNRTFADWTSRSEERESAIGELLKVLHQTMQSRKAMLLKYKQLKEKERSGSDKTKTLRPAFTEMRLERKK